MGDGNCWQTRERAWAVATPRLVLGRRTGVCGSGARPGAPNPTAGPSAPRREEGGACHLEAGSPGRGGAYGGGGVCGTSVGSVSGSTKGLAAASRGRCLEGAGVGDGWARRRAGTPGSGVPAGVGFGEVPEERDSERARPARASADAQFRAHPRPAAPGAAPRRRGAGRRGAGALTGPSSSRGAARR